jgi:Flp pilus assembly pilin Flp
MGGDRPSGEAARLTQKGATTWSSSFAGTLSRLPRIAGGGDIKVMFTDLIHYLRARFQVEEGQTMAEYGVVLAVLALGVVVALGLLSGAISSAIDKVRGIL